MAITQVVYLGSSLNGTNVTVNITGVAWAIGDILVVMFGIRDDNTTSDTCTGTGLTFTGRVHRQDVQGVDSIHAWVSDPAVSAQSGQTIALGTTGVSVGGQIAHVLVVTGGGAYDSSASNDTGAADTAAPTVTLSGPVASSRVYGGFTHRNRVFTVVTGTAIQLNDQIDAAGNIASMSTTYIDAAPGANPTLDGTLNSALDWAAAMVAITVGGGGGGGGVGTDRGIDENRYGMVGH